MFHLSKGCLSFMLSRKSLFAAANQKRSTEEKVGGLGDSEAPCVFDFLTNTKPFIVELKRACHLVNQYFLLEIDDSETTAYCIVDQDDVKDNYSNNKDERPQLDVGSVVIVNRIQFVSRIELPKFNLPDDYSNFESNFLMQIMSYTVIGTTNTEKQANSSVVEQHLQVVEQKPKVSHNQYSDFVSIVSESDLIKKAKFNVRALHKNILKKSDWELTLVLCQKTTIIPFEVRDSGKKSTRIRLQFRDESGYIEAVAFGNQATRMYDLEVNKMYKIQHADIKQGNPMYRQWPDQKFLSDCELLIGDSTLIELAEPTFDSPFPAIPTEATASLVVQSIVQTKASSRLNPKKLTKQEIAREKDNQYLAMNSGATGHKFTPLNLIPLLPVKSKVNLFGVVTKVEQYSTMNRAQSNPLEIRNISVSDTTGVDTRLAFWGKQAVNFTYMAGTILMINDAELVHYKGITLHIRRDTQVIEMTTNPFGYAEVAAIQDWWKSLSTSK